MPADDHATDPLADLPSGATVTRHLRSGETIEGVFKGIENELATVLTIQGPWQVRSAEVERALIHLNTPDPE